MHMTCYMIVLKGRVDAMASTGRNRTRLQTYCWPVYAIRAVVWLVLMNIN